ncbi:MAG TPA: SigE family RNA polymerase sigma factor [Micromonosporaceae bacterium]|nr:SigE family RNA polymerase sigma factor [Micromonosporaceae bacterium]
MVERYGFEEFAVARAKRLFQYAYLICGDWHQAEDLVQATLAKVYVAWRRVEHQENVDAYARRVLLRTYLSHRRLKRSSETPVAEVVAGAYEDDSADLRVTLMTALRALPPRHRAVVVLRYFEGQTSESVAAILGMTASAVKSINTRSLAAMRAALGAAREDLFKQ